jgi:hypothetical protein
MAAKRKRGEPSRLARARERLDRWRRKREKRTIPEELWELAVELAADYGVYRTARALGLNYESLKKRVPAACADARASREVSAKFWEVIPGVPGGRSSTAEPACVIEVEDGSGRKLRVQWKGDFAELSTLSRSLWRSA